MISKLQVFFFCLFATSISGEVVAQEDGPATNSGALRVFLDCNARNCDDNLFRTEVNFVNWVRDRTQADIHLIITSSQTGGGGSIYALDFIGLQNLDGQGDELTYTSPSSETDTVTRYGLARVIGVGLARYSTLIGQHQSFSITGVAAPAGATDRLVSSDEVTDPWNFWVFEIGTTLDISGEESETSNDYSLSFDASRTTPTWKFDFGAEGESTRDERERSSGEIIVDERNNWSSDVLLAYAFRDNWSLGVDARVGSSSSRNQDLSGSVFGIVEYSFFPYEEAPRRSFTARYSLGGRYFDWEEETIYGELQESHPQHQVRIRYYQRQTWGTASLTFNYSQYLHDTAFWNASLNGNLNFRISQGLSLNLRGDYSLIEDQLFISSAGLTDEEILLGSFQRPTDFEYSARVGITYEFGSIFNNVVNNRISGGGF